MKILVTGIAGFIGFHVAKKLLEQGYEVFGFDNLNDYYDVNLKYARLQELGLERNLIDTSKQVNSSSYPKLTFAKLSLEDRLAMEDLFKTEQFDLVCHLAAQAGVRYSLENPHSYAESK
jgi:UDP-glucuronate 4-epimerase